MVVINKIEGKWKYLMPMSEPIKSKCFKIGAWVQSRESNTMLGIISDKNGNKCRVDWKVASKGYDNDPTEWIAEGKLNLFISDTDWKRFGNLNIPAEIPMKRMRSAKAGNKKRLWTPPSPSPPSTPNLQHVPAHSRVPSPSPAASHVPSQSSTTSPSPAVSRTPNSSSTASRSPSPFQPLPLPSTASRSPSPFQLLPLPLQKSFKDAVVGIQVEDDEQQEEGGQQNENDLQESDEENDESDEEDVESVDEGDNDEDNEERERVDEQQEECELQVIEETKQQGNELNETDKADDQKDDSEQSEEEEQNEQQEGELHGTEENEQQGNELNENDKIDDQDDDSEQSKEGEQNEQQKVVAAKLKNERTKQQPLQKKEDDHHVLQMAAAQREKEEWMIATLGKPGDDENFNNGMHGLFGYSTDPTKFSFDDLGPYEEDIASFRTDLRRLYGNESFQFDIWTDNLDSSFPGTNPFKRSRSRPSSPPEHPKAKEQGMRKVSAIGTRESSSSSSLLTSGNGTDTTSSHHPSSIGPDTATTTTSSLSSSSSTSRDTEINVSGRCHSHCLGKCTVGMCMFYAGFLPEASDPAADKLKRVIEDNFLTIKAPQPVVLQGSNGTHQVFVPLKTKAELEIGGTKCYWVNTTLSEFIYTNRIGLDVLTWTERGTIRCLYAGQLFRSKSKETGLRFVLKILRGKCKDTKIRLLVAVYEQAEWTVRYMNRSEAHKEFLNENLPMSHFVSPLLQETISLQYHEQTASLYHAFDAMGGTSGGAHFADFHVGRNYQLTTDQLHRLMNRAFPEEAEIDRDRGLYKDDLIAFNIIAPHQFDCASARQALQHRKDNMLLRIHQSEGTKN